MACRRGPFVTSTGEPGAWLRGGLLPRRQLHCITGRGCWRFRSPGAFREPPSRKTVEGMRLLVFITVMVAASATFVVQAIGERQTPPPVGQTPSTPRDGKQVLGEEKTVQGQIRSINASEREITLTNGTQFVVPLGAPVKPLLLREGTTVIASYKEESGKNVLTALAVVAPSSPLSDSLGSSAPSPPGSPKRDP